MTRAAGLALLAAGLFLSGCQDAPRTHSETRFLLGTLVKITVYGPPRPEAVEAAFADMARLHEALHPWKPGSLGRLNRLLPGGEWVTAAPTVLPVLEAAKRQYRASGGLFNPAIGKLVALWGFHRDEPPRRPPAEADIQALLARRPTMDDVEIEGLRVRSRNPAVQLDFGGSAKGHAVDVALARLRRLGVTDVLVDAGGDLRVSGRHGDRPWRIGIRHPRRAAVLASVALSDGEAIFTSGDYERYFIYQGRRYHHILDPRSGYPASGAQSVTVIHDNGLDADAAATALFVAGPEEWPAVARAMGIRYVMRVAADGTVQMNPAMAQRIRFEVDPPPEVKLTAPLAEGP